jgi:cell division protein FtsN
MMKNQLGSSRMDIVLKMLLIAFISLLAFSSGVYFGKQLSDSDYELKALKSDFNHDAEVAKTDSADTARDTNPEDAINEEEVSALSEKLINSEKETVDKEESARTTAKNEKSVEKESKAQANHEVAAKTTKTAATEAKTEAKPDLTAASKAAMRIAQNASPEEPVKRVETRVPSSLPKTVGSSQDVEFTVQVASYPTAEAAKQHANELVKKGFPAFPVEATVGGKVWYRVSVGSFKTQKEATLYRAELLKQTTVASAIVQKIQR